MNQFFYAHIGKSFRSKKDSDLINFDSDNAKIEIEYKKTDREGKIKLDIIDKKIFFVNDVKQNKISDILGKINVVIFTPDDIDIIKDGPQRRRKFLDMMISSIRPNYVHLLNNYNKTLEQRNNYLRQIKLDNKDIELLDIWDEQLAKESYKIYEYRNEFINKISNNIEDFHNLITKSGKETIKIKYISSSKSEEDIINNLKKSREIDINRGYTAVGIHRDDFIIYLDSKPISVFGSQGQQRTVVLTLKLCEHQIIKDEIGEEPVLLLDDFMSELDEKRRKNFLENIKDCQVIITCTDEININTDCTKFFVENGKCTKQN